MDLQAELATCADRLLFETEVEAMCARLEGTEEEALDRASAFVARRYVDDELPFAIADGFMNSVWQYSLNLPQIPALMYAIYEAFDAGEYHHAGDAEAVDPGLKYTRPILERILSEAGPA